MAIMPTPEAPELYRKSTGRWAIIFPTVNVKGGKCLGSEPLNTTDDKQAAKLFKVWKAEGRFEQRTEADQKRAAVWLAERAARPKVATVKGDTNGNGVHLPALLDGKPEKRAYNKRVPVNIRQARQQLKMLSAQLHAIALNVQILGEQLDAADDD